MPRRADNVELAPRISEDWLSLIIGLFIFILALAGIANVDLLGWVVTTSVWSDAGKALGTVSKSYASLGGFGALVATYVALLVILSAAAVALKSDIRKFALAFTAVFWIAYASWIIGNFANFAAVTPAELQKFGISWSLKLTNEGAYIFALIAGLVIANVFPRFAEGTMAIARALVSQPAVILAYRHQEKVHLAKGLVREAVNTLKCRSIHWSTETQGKGFLHRARDPVNYLNEKKIKFRPFSNLRSKARIQFS